MGLSQISLAEISKLSASYINDLERGRKFPSAYTLTQLCTALMVQPYQLFIDDAEPKEANTAIALQQQLKNDMSQVIDEAIKKYLL